MLAAAFCRSFVQLLETSAFVVHVLEAQGMSVMPSNFILSSACALRLRLVNEAALNGQTRSPTSTCRGHRGIRERPPMAISSASGDS